MARPVRKKKDQELLADQEIYRLIKQHPEVKACKSMTLDQIRAVFRAYKDIVYTAAKRDIRISLPCLGQFFSSEEKGWQGGYVTYRMDFNDENSEKRDYFPPKPDYKLLRFEFHKAIRNKFREETRKPQDKKILKQLKKEADEKERERIKNGKVDSNIVVNIKELLGDSDE